METQMNARFAGISAMSKPAACGLIAVLMCACILCPSSSADTNALQALLDRASVNVSTFLDTISEVNCTEHLTQERIADNGKTLEKHESAFDYLVLLSNTGGELNLVESRVAAKSNKDSEKAPLLVSNGFSMLLLIFHPYYSGGFQFSLANGDSDVAGGLISVNFQHTPGARSPAALALRGREYPLEISGTAWIDPTTGVIKKIAAWIGTEMEDVGLRKMKTEIEYAPVSFQIVPGTYWLPAYATVEVESRHQHWRNTHIFSAYKRFSVNTKEQVSNHEH
jgi:hypothetical protein